MLSHEWEMFRAVKSEAIWVPHSNVERPVDKYKMTDVHGFDPTNVT